MPASLSFAKIVATPTETAWSQVYHAGNLFALVSLSSEKSEDLNLLGKEMFNSLESNFFSLEKKTLTTIHEVINESLKDVPATLTVNACIAFSREAILYLFLVGDGMMYMKRGDKIGVILSQKDATTRDVHSSSGYLNHGDVLLMQTGAFSRLVTPDVIKDALDSHLPNDITEKLSSHISDLPGDASVVTLLYQGATSPDALTPAQEMRKSLQQRSPLEDVADKKEVEEADEDEKTEEEEFDKEKHAAADEKEDEVSTAELHPALENDARDSENGEEEEATLDDPLPTRDVAEHEEMSFEKEAPSPVTVTRRSLPFPSLTNKRNLIGLVAVLLVIALFAGIFLTKQTKQSTETKAVYEETYAQASKAYDEAEGLKNLNASLAQDDYKKAAAIIKAGLPKVKKGSEEEKKLRELLAKVEANIVNTAGATVQTKSVDLSESPLLELASAASSAYVASDDEKHYALTSNVVREGDEEIIENDDDWTSPTGLGAYNGNLYVLDKKEGILKFTAGSDGYGKSSYFTGDAPSMSSAVSMAIDGSVYVLFSDGKVKKYTRGKEESFSIRELPSPLSSPKQLVTSVDMDSIYILDTGNSRIVRLSKEGSFEKAWKADILSTATAIDVQEEEKKIYILKGKNLFMMTIE